MPSFNWANENISKPHAAAYATGRTCTKLLSSTAVNCARPQEHACNHDFDSCHSNIITNMDGVAKAAQFTPRFELTVAAALQQYPHAGAVPRPRLSVPPLYAGVLHGKHERRHAVLLRVKGRVGVRSRCSQNLHHLVMPCWNGCSSCVCAVATAVGDDGVGGCSRPCFRVMQSWAVLARSAAMARRRRFKRRTTVTSAELSPPMQANRSGVAPS
jgi:hypothetical protein